LWNLRCWLGSRYVSGRTRDWLKFKNPASAAVKREAEKPGGIGVDGFQS
jgi:hypothetical protein